MTLRTQQRPTRAYDRLVPDPNHPTACMAAQRAAARCRKPADPEPMVPMKDFLEGRQIRTVYVGAKPPDDYRLSWQNLIIWLTALICVVAVWWFGFATCWYIRDHARAWLHFGFHEIGQWMLACWQFVVRS
jgi:hypothetical protein